MFSYRFPPLFLRSVPVAWRSDFVPESKEAESKMGALKRNIRTSEVKVTEKWVFSYDTEPVVSKQQLTTLIYYYILCF